ncbi:efflux RND transporter periplasmic adaptor subunit [Desulfobacula sp.]
MKILKKLLIIIPIICGIIFFAVMKTNKQAPVRLKDKERVQAVRVIPLEKMEVVPRVVSYGYVEADRTWQAISEVSGKIVSVNENLKKGYFIKKDEVLFKIDTTSYGLAETRGVADVMNVEARLKELEQSRENAVRLLSIEKKSLASAGQELQRKRELFEKQYISASDLEKEERTFLGHQTMVNNLQNTLNLIPSQKKALMAQKKAGESTVTERRLDVARTEIRAPFNCRLSAVNIELSQFAAAGTILVEAESIDRAEIPVSLTPKSLMTLMSGNHGGLVGQMPDMEIMRRAIGITAKVRLPMDGEFPVVWDGSFSRTSESMDIKTGTLTIYITVEKPYENIIPGKRPPLVTNMYVEVELKGRSLPDRFVVPRSSVHDKKLYICNSDNRLDIRSVDIEFYMADVAVLSEGLKAGEILVLADLMPAIQGMRLKPVEAKEVVQRLKQQAIGGDLLR